MISVIPRMCVIKILQKMIEESEKKSECFTSRRQGFGIAGLHKLFPAWTLKARREHNSKLCWRNFQNWVRNQVHVYPRGWILSALEMNRTRTSSEASMDAAYLDKISELDSMMSESDNSKSPCNNGFKSLDLDGLSKSSQCSEFLEETDKLEERTKPNLSKGSLTTDQLEWKWMETQFFFSPLSIWPRNEWRFFTPFQFKPRKPMKSKPPSCLFQTEFSQGVLLSSTNRLFEDQRFGSSLFKMSSEMPGLHNHLQSPWSTFVPEKRNKNVNQSAKRKSRAAFPMPAHQKQLKVDKLERCHLCFCPESEYKVLKLLFLPLIKLCTILNW